MKNMKNMKKRAVMLLFVFAVSLFPIPITVHAADKNFVVDEMQKLSAGELRELNDYAGQISTTYQLDVAMFIVSNSYSPEKTIYKYAEELYRDAHKLQKGFALVHDAEGKSWGVLGFGQIERFITEEVEDGFWAAYNKNDTYYDGVLAYLKAAEEFLATVGDYKLDYVADFAGLLSFDEWNKLSARAANLSEKYKCDIHIVTVDDMKKYGYSDIEEFSYDIYLDYSLGYGSAKNCALLLLSMKARDYDMRVWGSRAKTAFTLYGIDDLLDSHVLPKLKYNNYYEGFSKYLDRAEVYFEMAEKGKPFDRSTDPYVVFAWIVIKLAVTVLVPLVMAGSICSAWKKQMKTAVTARAADNYIPQNGFRLTRQEDVFLYRRQAAEKSKPHRLRRRAGQAAAAGAALRDAAGNFKIL